MAACESGIDLGNSIPFDFVLLLPLSFTCPVFCPGLKISFGVYGVEGGGGWTWGQGMGTSIQTDGRNGKTKLSLFWGTLPPLRKWAKSKKKKKPMRFDDKQW